GSATTANLIIGNLIGTDPTGTVNDLGNLRNGIYVQDQTQHNIIGGPRSDGNVISGNSKAGILLTGDKTLVSGNFIGTDLTGTMAIGNQQGGIDIQAGSREAIGQAIFDQNDVPKIDDSASNVGNVISGNVLFGILVIGLPNSVGVIEAIGNLITHNLIGTDASGLVAVPNVAGSPNQSGEGLDGDGVVVADAQRTFGQTAAHLELNVISGNEGNGVRIFGLARLDSGERGTNFIGTDITGNKALGNQQNGVLVSGQGGYLGTEDVI